MITVTAYTVTVTAAAYFRGHDAGLRLRSPTQWSRGVPDAFSSRRKDQCSANGRDTQEGEIR
jgi:hypothetical protein